MKPQKPGNTDLWIQLESGPDKEGKHTFFAYWKDTYLPPSGVRGQIFRTDLQRFIESGRQRGQKVKIIDFDPTKA